MTQKTIQGFMFMEFESDWAHGKLEREWLPRWRAFKPADDATSVFVREMDVTFEVPDDFDPIPRQVAALEAEKRAALAEYQSKVAEINERLSKLQALTFEPAEGL